METDEQTPAATTEEDTVQPTDSEAQDGRGVMIVLPSGGKVTRQKDGRFKSPNRRGSNQNGKTHGMRGINQAWKNRLPIDGKTASGKHEKQVFDSLVWAFGNGSTDNIDPVSHILIQIIADDAGYWHKQKRAEIAFFKKAREEARKKGQSVPRQPSPKLLAMLRSYQQPTLNSLRDGLKALGKPPDRDTPKLQDILDGIAAETEGENRGGEGGGEP